MQNRLSRQDPGVVVVVTGRRLSVCDLLVASGFLALAPDLYRREPANRSPRRHSSG
jgi:dienelactone hydrolase